MTPINRVKKSNIDSTKKNELREFTEYKFEDEEDDPELLNQV